MRVDRAKVKSSHRSELPEKCRQFVDELKNYERDEFCCALSQAAKDWKFGKMEMVHWVDILDKCDEVLEEGCAVAPSSQWLMECDRADAAPLRSSITAVLEFTAQLFEHSFSRHLYNSIEWLAALLNSGDVALVVSALRCLYVFSKRSAYLTKLPAELRARLVGRLLAIAENWGGDYRGVGLAKCCQPGVAGVSFASPPVSFQAQVDGEGGATQCRTEQIGELAVRVAAVAAFSRAWSLVEADALPGAVVEELLARHRVDESERALLGSRVRLVVAFHSLNARRLCVTARLLAISVLVYSRYLHDESQVNLILYSTFIEELVALLCLPTEKDAALDLIKTDTLRTLTSIIYLDRAPKVPQVVDALGASSYYGLLAKLTRRCVAALQSRQLCASVADSDDADAVSVHFCTALFSFLYHLAGYDNGSEALVACGLTESLLSVVSDHGLAHDQISFVTRSVRVLDMITSIDNQAFAAAAGVQTLVNRLMNEVDECRKEQPFEIVPAPMPVVQDAAADDSASAPLENADEDTAEAGPSGVASEPPLPMETDALDLPKEPVAGVRCHTQRSALIKSLLNFIKRAIQDAQLTESVRHIMDGPLASVLKHIASNSDYYGGALFQNAVTVTTNFIYQEPSQLSALQDKGLTSVILEALLNREVPPSREILASLPTTFAALCLNERGLQSFLSFEPFNKLFKVLLSPKYLPAMRRKKNDPSSDTAVALGAAVDELMRHQPTLKDAAIRGVVDLLEQLCAMGMDDEKYVCASKWSSRASPAGWSPSSASESAARRGAAVALQQGSSNDSSDEEMDEADAVAPSDNVAEAASSGAAAPFVGLLGASEDTLPPSQTSASDPQLPASAGRTPVPLLDYTYNSMKFLEAIVTNNATDDHARLFVAADGLKHLYRLICLKNAPTDFGQSSACHAIALNFRHILTQTKDADMLTGVLMQLGEEVLRKLDCLDESMPHADGSRLVRDYLESVDECAESKSLADVDLARCFGHLQSHLLVLLTLAKFGFASAAGELKERLLRVWSDETGSLVIARLNALYRFVIWESCVLLGYCSADAEAKASNFGGDQLTKLKAIVGRKRQAAEEGGASTAPATADQPADVPMEVDGASASTSSQQLQQQTGAPPRMSPELLQEIKPFLSLTSRLGRSVSELLAHVARACLSTPGRQRRQVQQAAQPPTPAAAELATSLMTECKQSLRLLPPRDGRVPDSLRLSYVSCSISFLSSCLFDERRQAYQLMLEQFLATGCHAAFFQCFESVLGQDLSRSSESVDLPEGVEDFLELWLSLQEKLLGTDGMLRSPYAIAEGENKRPKNFSMIWYLMRCQSDVLRQLKVLFGLLPRLRGSKVAVMAVSLCTELLRSAVEVKRDLHKDKAAEKKASEEERRELAEQLDPLHIQHLMDMGFSHEMVLDALIESGSLQEATELLLSQPLRAQPPGAAAAAASAAAAAAAAASAALTEEQELAAAIAMSLQEPAAADNAEASASAAASEAAPIEEQATGAVEDGGAASPVAVADDAPTEQAPDAASRMAAGGGAESTPAAPDSDDAQSEESSVASLEPVELNAAELSAFVEQSAIPLGLELLDDSPELVYKLADMASVAVKELGAHWSSNELLSTGLIDQTAKLSESGLEALTSDGNVYFESKSATSLFTRVHLLCLMFSDLSEEAVQAFVSRGLDALLVAFLEKCCATEFESPMLSKLLGSVLLCLEVFEKTSVCCKRKAKLLHDHNGELVWKYQEYDQWMPLGPMQNRLLTQAFRDGQSTVSFTVSRRNYAVDLQRMTQTNTDTGNARAVIVVPSAPRRSSDASTSKSAASPSIAKPAAFRTLTREQHAAILRCCVQLLAPRAVDADVLNSALRLILRSVRQADLAADFLHLGGLRRLLLIRRRKGKAAATCTSAPAVNLMVALIVRNVLEDDATLRHTMEKVVRAIGQGAHGAEALRWARARRPTEFNHAVQSLAPVAARHPDQFLAVAKETLRFVVPPGINAPAGAQPAELKVVPPSPTYSAAAAQSPSTSVREVIVALLEHVLRDSTAADDESDGELLVQRTTALALVAELVRSYSAVASVVADFKSNETTALAYVLDNMLCAVATDDKKQEAAESQAAARTLFATLSAASHAQRAQESVVTEVKAALHRAMFSSSNSKHQKLIALASLISVMKDSCPTVAVNQQQQPNHHQRLPTINTNSILRLFYRKRVCLDLARVPRYLDLSSKEAIEVVNAVLRTLEELTRLINAPFAQSPTAASSSANVRAGEGGGGVVTSAAPIAPITQASIGVAPAPVTLANTALPSSVQSVGTADEVARFVYTQRYDVSVRLQSSVVVEQEQSAVAAPNIVQRVDSVEQQQHAATTAQQELHSVQDSGAERVRANDECMRVAGLAAPRCWLTDSSSSSNMSGDDDDDDDGSSDTPGEDDDDDEDADGANEHLVGGAAERALAAVVANGETSRSSSDAGELVREAEDRVDDDDDAADADAHTEYDGDDDDEMDEDEDPWAMGGGLSEDDLATAVGEMDDGRALIAFRGALNDMIIRERAELRAGAPLRLFIETAPGQMAIPDVERFLQASLAASGNIMHADDGARATLGASAIEHPMLRAPAVGSQAASSATAGEQRAPTVQDLLTQPNASRLMAMSNGAARGLVRQNAIRDRHFYRIRGLQPGRNNNEAFERAVFLGQQDVVSDWDLPRFELRTRMFDYAGMGDEGGARRSTGTSSVPSALSRWHEEARILDGHSMHILVALLRPDLQIFLDGCRQGELDERRAAIQASPPQPPDAPVSSDSAAATRAPTDGVVVEGDHQPPLSTAAQTDDSIADASTAADVAVVLPAADNQDVEMDAVAQEEAVSSAALNGAVDAAPIEAEPSSNVTNASAVTVNSTDSESLPVESEPARQEEVDTDAEATTAETQPTTNGVAVDAAEAAPSAETSGAEAAASNADSDDDARWRAELETFRAILGDINVPRGVDPAFLAALPENMRQEVIEDHLRAERIQRMREEQQRQRDAAATAAAAAEERTGADEAAVAAPPSDAAGEQPAEVEGGAAGGVQEISQEFLNALPPELQEEVLNQQRLAQQAAANANRASLGEAADPVAFLESLPPSLRQSILADTDDDTLGFLPAHLVGEARRLRESFVDRQRLRRVPAMHSLLGAGGAGFAGGVHFVGSRAREHRGNERAGGAFAAQSTLGALAGVSTLASSNGLQLLDREALTGLLVLFFVDSTRLNSGRLQKILKSICCHPGSCDFLVHALLSILEKLEQRETECAVDTSRASCSKTSAQQPSWLDNITINTGLGNAVRVLEAKAACVRVHPLLAQVVCRQVLDALISVARAFPGQLVPAVLRHSGGDAPSTAKADATAERDFWQVLLRLNTSGFSQPSAGDGGGATRSSTSSQKGRTSLCRWQSSFSLSDDSNYRTLEEAPVGRLMCMLRHPVVASSSTLLDRLIRLLAQVVMTLPDDTFARLTPVGRAAATDSDQPLLVDQLQSVVDVVTKGDCGDEGLQDGRSLLMESVRTLGKGTRAAVYAMLLTSAKQLGETLADEIRQLLEQVGDSAPKDEAASASSSKPSVRGSLQNRFEQDDTVVVGTAAARGQNRLSDVAAASNCAELQTPAANSLMQKQSRQRFLLRALQTLIRLREAMRNRDNELELRAQHERRVLAETERRMAADALEPTETDEQRRERIRLDVVRRLNGEQSDPVDAANAEQAAPADDAAAASSAPVAPAQTASAETASAETAPAEAESLSDLLVPLEPLWQVLSRCLLRLGDASDPHAVLLLQPAAESFFLVHASSISRSQAADSQSDAARATSPPSASQEVGVLREGSVVYTGNNADMEKLIRFSQDHRRVLNHILRGSSGHLSDGPFAVLIDYPRLLDFDVKRRYFRKELQRVDERIMGREDVPIRVRRSHVFQDSYRELFRLRPNEWKYRFYVMFEGEEGQDAGGLLREWFSIITREIFNPNYALFITAPGDRVTYMINRTSNVNDEHLVYFKFVGRLIAKAIYDNKLLDCYFTRAFYKHILNKPVRYQDIESEDPSYYQSLVFMLNNPIDELGEFTFSLEVDEFGVRSMRDLKAAGADTKVTDENKTEYVGLVCQMKMTGSIRQQLDAFLEGFYSIIPKALISIFNEQELELLISGLPTIDIDDLQQHTDYRGYSKNSLQMQWFWRALRSFEQEDRAKFLQFVTGTSKVPLQGFGTLEGMNGVQRFSIHHDGRSTDRLPAAHTCFNQLDLPAYESYDKLRRMMLTAVRECTEGFGFA